MNQLSVKSKRLDFKSPITIFSLIALVCTLIGCIRYFVTYTSDYVDYEQVYDCVVKFPNIFGFLYLLAEIVPCVLLVIYALKILNESKSKILMPIIFGAFAFSGLLTIVEDISDDIAYDGNLVDISEYFTYYGFTEFLTLVKIIAFSLATISAIKGFSKKLFPVAAVYVGLFIGADSLVNFLPYIPRYIERSPSFNLFIQLMAYIGLISLFIALLFFILNDLNDEKQATTKEERYIEKMPPEKSLKYLKEISDLGLITEEEYQIKRAEVISRL